MNTRLFMICLNDIEYELLKVSKEDPEAEGEVDAKDFRVVEFDEIKKVIESFRRAYR